MCNVLKIKLRVDNNHVLNEFIVAFKHFILSSCLTGFFKNLTAIRIKIIHLLFIKSHKKNTQTNHVGS